MGDKNIVPGYQLHVTTWENDLNSVSVKIINGLSKADVSFFLDILNNFCSANNWTGEIPNLGNEIVSDGVLTQVINTALDNNPDISESIRVEWTNPNKDIWDILCKTLLDYPENEYYCEEPNFCRVFDSFDVYYFPHEIECVTSEFKK